jgi:outer membrane receptor protein involved in Fe transport
VAYTLPSFGGKTEIYLNIQNLFDREPAIWANPNVYGAQAPFAGLNNVAPGDDGIGRYFTLGFRYRM